MLKYICSICGFIYDEAAGHPASGIQPMTLWSDVPDNWTCPLCGASKSEFKSAAAVPQKARPAASIPLETATPSAPLSSGAISALFSNLAKGCEKQYHPIESELFNQLSQYYAAHGPAPAASQLSDLALLVSKDLDETYSTANEISAAAADRGALRTLTWGEKVTRILNSTLSRYESQGSVLLENTQIFVCEICGFVYIGDDVPEICPVCKVPSMKIKSVERG